MAGAYVPSGRTWVKTGNGACEDTVKEGSAELINHSVLAGSCGSGVTNGSTNLVISTTTTSSFGSKVCSGSWDDVTGVGVGSGPSWSCLIAEATLVVYELTRVSPFGRVLVVLTVSMRQTGVISLYGTSTTVIGVTSNSPSMLVVVARIVRVR